MITGIQITKAVNDDLLNSIWLLDSETNEARCVAASAGFEADQVIPTADLGEYESREIAIEAPAKIEGGQHLNVNVLKRETLEDAAKHPEKYPQLTIRSHYAECFTDELDRMKLNLVAKDMNANTLTYYVSGNRKKVRRLVSALQHRFDNADVNTHKVSLVSAVGSDMSIPGLLARSVGALNKADVPVRAVHQSLRAVEMQFIVDDEYYEQAVVSLHDELVQTHADTVALAVA